MQSISSSIWFFLMMSGGDSAMMSPVVADETALLKGFHEGGERPLGRLARRIGFQLDRAERRLDVCGYR